MKLAKEHNIEIITSTPCFEIWFLLHFTDTTRTFSSNKELLNKIKEYLPNYAKNMDAYTQLKELIPTAIENAKKLENSQLRDGKVLNTVSCNPYTSVYKIVEELIKRNCNR